jgi:osmotically-inducible protein OsmY
MKSDAQIQQDVAGELSWDTRIQSTNVLIDVHNGCVALGGIVSDYIQKIAAQEAAYRVARVLDVVNHISVHWPDTFECSDRDIAQAVRHALESDVVVPDTHIRSMIANGWVTLEGDVDTWHQRRAAERAVRNLVGVRGLIDKIEVCLPALAPQTIHEEIDQALRRRAERQAKRIQVEVSDGTVSLIGPVHSRREREAVLGAARATPGVHRVNDLLTVEQAERLEGQL